MSTAPNFDEVPQWTLGDRMDKARRNAGLGVAEMALRFRVSRGTVGNWINDRVEVDYAVLVMWADVTGVDLHWLETGEAPTTSGGDGGLRSATTEEYRRPVPNPRRESEPPFPPARHLRVVREAA